MTEKEILMKIEILNNKLGLQIARIHALEENVKYLNLRVQSLEETHI